MTAAIVITALSSVLTGYAIFNALMERQARHLAHRLAADAYQAGYRQGQLDAQQQPAGHELQAWLDRQRANAHLQ